MSKRRRVRGGGLTLLGLAAIAYVVYQTVRGWWAEHRDALLHTATGRLLSAPALLWLAAATLTVVVLRAWAGRRPARGVPTPVTLADLEPVRGVRNDGAQLERLVADLIVRDGGQAQRTGGSGDRGVDVVGETTDGRLVIVQCKQYAADATIGPGQVRELAGAAAITGRRPLSIFVTTAAGFSAQAQAEARDGGVVLIDRRRLDAWMRGAHLAELDPTRPPLRERAKGWAGRANEAAGWVQVARERGRRWRA